MVIKNKLMTIAIAVAAVTGAAVGVFWVFAGSSFKCDHWWLWACESLIVNLIAYASCPFIYLDLSRFAIVIIPSLNGAMYGLLVYLILRNRPIISAGILFGYVTAVYWAAYWGTEGYIFTYNWVSYSNFWLAYALCPFVGFMRTHNQIVGFLPLLNAIYVLLLIYVIRRYAKRPSALIIIIGGYAVGMFWAVALNHGNHGMDVRDWFPNWTSWLAYVTCPFVNFAQLDGTANGLVPVLNASYGLLIYTLFTRIYQRIRVNIH